MTEFEKMTNGLLYDPSDQELDLLRLKARQAADRYNRSNAAEYEERVRILREILGGAGENLYIEPSIRLEYGKNISIGNDCFFNFDCRFLDCGRIEIGNRAMVGPGVFFLTPMHPLRKEERSIRTDENGRKYDLEYALPIKVGDDVWIGGNVTINPGVTIGDGAVIGSGSVVTRDIPAGVLAAGVPCRVIRPITEKDAIGPEFFAKEV